jgi:hypothetical protein
MSPWTSADELGLQQLLRCGSAKFGLLVVPPERRMTTTTNPSKPSLECPSLGVITLVRSPTSPPPKPQTWSRALPQRKPRSALLLPRSG